MTITDPDAHRERGQDEQFIQTQMQYYIACELAKLNDNLSAMNATANRRSR